MAKHACPACKGLFASRGAVVTHMSRLRRTQNDTVHQDVHLKPQDQTEVAENPQSPRTGASSPGLGANKKQKRSSKPGTSKPLAVARINLCLKPECCTSDYTLKSCCIVVT